jgi:DNA ligase (NAD+)
VKQIQHSKEQPLWRILNALGIPHIGKKTAQDINHFLSEEHTDSLEKIQKILTNAEKINEVYGIGSKTVASLYNFFTNLQTQELLQQLEQQGLSFSAQEMKKTTLIKESFSIT